MGIGSREFFYWSQDFAYQFWHVPFSFIRTQLIWFYYTSGKIDLGGLVWFMDPSGPVCFGLRWSGVFFWTSVSRCVFGPQWSSVFFGPRWSGVFQTSVVWCSDLGGQVCFGPWWSGVFLDLDGPVHFWTSVVYCILDLGGQLRFCSTWPESVVSSFVSLGPWWLSVILIVLDLCGHLMLDFDAKCNSVAATIARAQ